MLIASYNVQNLFERASALSAEAGTAGARAVEAQAEINVSGRCRPRRPRHSAARCGPPRAGGTGRRALAAV